LEGWLKEIHEEYNRGSEFQGAVEVLCEEFGIIQADGQVEKRNADIMRSLEREMIEDEEWDI
jgi:hypothetical protein